MATDEDSGPDVSDIDAQIAALQAERNDAIFGEVERQYATLTAWKDRVTIAEACFGHTVHRLAKDYRLTQGDVADRLGIAQSTVSRYVSLGRDYEAAEVFEAIRALEAEVEADDA